MGFQIQIELDVRILGDQLRVTACFLAQIVLSDMPRNNLSLLVQVPRLNTRAMAVAATELAWIVSPLLLSVSLQFGELGRMKEME